MISGCNGHLRAPISIYDLVTSRNFYFIDFYLWVKWTGDIDPLETMRFVNRVDEWDSLKEEGSAKHITLPDGTKYQFLRIEGRFVHPFNFKHYTFDRQTLRILTEDEEHSTEELVYSIDQKNSRVEKIFRLRAGTSSVLRLKSRNGTMTQTSA
jgi:hypothetical protein